jgi:branched-chain amino acid transport system substrate-binding protein
MKVKKVLNVLFVLMLVIFTVACSNSQESNAKKSEKKTNQSNHDSIKIGMINPLSGASADYGITTMEGAELAKEEINQNGGLLNGLPIELLSEDDQTSPEGAVNGIKKLINQDGVNIIAGGSNSSIAMAAKEATRNKIFHVVVAAQAQDITDKGHKWLFNISPTVVAYAEPLIDYVINKIKPKTVSILVEDTDYGQGNLDLAEKKFKAAGIKVKTVEWFTQQDTKFDTKASLIKNDHSDVVYTISASSTQIGQIYKNYKDYGVKGTWVHSSGTLNREGMKLSEGATEDVITADAYDLSIPNELNKHFVEAYKKKYNKEPIKTAAFGYITVKVIAQIIDKAGTYTDYDKMAQVAKQNAWESLIGDVKFDDNGRNKGQMFIQKVSNGNFELKK